MEQEEIEQESEYQTVNNEKIKEEYPPEFAKKQEKKRRKISFLAELLLYVLIVAFCLLFVPRYVVQRTVVDGDSMMDTLLDEDNLIVEKISYHFDNPKRFDIIVFYPYGRDDERYFVKRIIGLPGETIQIIGDRIFINGELLEENYGKDPMTNSGIASEPLQLADDEYFVLGDNREISLDSRYSEVGPVKRELIEGKVVFRIYPFNSIGTIE